MLTFTSTVASGSWESPTLGAWGLGWEVWLNGMEVTQFTYFQQVGGLDCRPVLGELTYGLERLAMYLQGKDNIFDLVWVDGVTYRDVYHQNEVEQSKYNFELANVEWLLSPQTLGDVASWADEVQGGINQTALWHYVNIPPDAKAYDRDRDCPRQPGVAAGSRLMNFGDLNR